MKLSALVAALAGVRRHGVDPEISAICADSRQVGPGSLFVAVPGFATDGHAYIAQAIAAGASAVLVQDDHDTEVAAITVPWATTLDTRSALSAVCAAFHAFPAERLRVIGVTGTDGKTTTAYLINALLEAAGRATGLVGTVDFKVGEQWTHNGSRLTTPGAPEVQALLAEMVTAGVQYAIVESTSHGLELHRLDHCQYDVAVFTNLTPDHLDLHKTMDAYRAAKGRLFEMLDNPSSKSGPRYAVLNLDDPASKYMRSRTSAPVSTYGLTPGADVWAEEIASRPNATKLRVQSTKGSFEFVLPMPGLFNVSNALAAIGVGIGEGLDPAVIVQALESFAGVPGRMERIDSGQPFAVIVDYAHTGEALRKVLTSVQPATRGKIVVVFGSAGERGHSRRAGMAEAAAELADFSILTDEDPRSEDPTAIIHEIATELERHGRHGGVDFIEILDRQEAIREAMHRAQPGDLVLVAGKGHEQSIEIAGEKRPWDDRAAARRALAEEGYNSASLS